MNNLKRITDIDDEIIQTSDEKILKELTAQRWSIVLDIFEATKKSLANFDDVEWEEAWKQHFSRQREQNATAASPSVSPEPHGQQELGRHHRVPA